MYELQFIVLSGLPLVLLLWRCRAIPVAAGLRRRWGLITGLLLFLAYGLTAGTVHMMFGYRLFLPLIPALFALLLLATGSVSRSRRIVACSVGLAQQIGVWLFLMYRGVNPTLMGEFNDWSVRKMFQFSDELWEPLAVQLRLHWDSHGTRGVQPRITITEAGQVPYRLKHFYVYDGGLVAYRSRCHQPCIDLA